MKSKVLFLSGQFACPECGALLMPTNGYQLGVQDVISLGSFGLVHPMATCSLFGKKFIVPVRSIEIDATVED